MSEIFGGMFFVMFMTLLIICVNSICVNDNFEAYATEAEPISADLNSEESISTAKFVYYSALSESSAHYTKELVYDFISSNDVILTPASDIHRLYTENADIERGNIVVYTYVNEDGVQAISVIRTKDMQWRVADM